MVMGGQGGVPERMEIEGLTGLHGDRSPDHQGSPWLHFSPLTCLKYLVGRAGSCQLTHHLCLRSQVRVTCESTFTGKG